MTRSNSRSQITEPFGKEITMIKKILLAFGITAMSLSAAACNTVRGAGSDLQSAANAVDEET